MKNPQFFAFCRTSTTDQPSLSSTARRTLSSPEEGKTRSPPYHGKVKSKCREKKSRLSRITFLEVIEVADKVDLLDSCLSARTRSVGNVVLVSCRYVPPDHIAVNSVRRLAPPQPPPYHSRSAGLDFQSAPFFGYGKLADGGC